MSNLFPSLSARGEIADLVAESLSCFLRYSGDAMSHLDAALAKDPQLAEAHILRAWMLLSTADSTLVPLARECVRMAYQVTLNPLNRAHVEALDRWCAGDWIGAARIVEDLSLHNPRDILALLAGHILDYYLGDARQMLCRIERAIPHWNVRDPAWHAILGMYAFALEENHRYEEAERFGKMAVEAEPRNTWAQHAVAHVYEMQCRPAEGIAWMQSNPLWQTDSVLSPHNWWHLALFHITHSDFDSALSLYDGPITTGIDPRPLPLQDAASMLWRLHLQGQAVGDRWNALAESWSVYADDRWNAFNDWHAMMAFVGANRADLVSRKLEAQRTASNEYRLALDNVGRAATLSIIAHGEGDHRRVVDLLRPIRSRSYYFGGSNAQRDLIDLTLIDSARRSGQRTLAEAVELERRNALLSRSAA